MELEPDAETTQWLEDFAPDYDNFDWDDGNTDKNDIKHGFSDEEIQSILKTNYVFAGRIIQPRHDEWRGLILTWLDANRPAALIFTRRNQKLRPISCRTMRWEKRKLYAEKTSS